MSSCTCTDATVTFQNGTVLVRCAAHELSRWLVHGREVSTTVALAGLRELFRAERVRPVRRTAERRQVVRLPQPRAVEAYEPPVRPAAAPDDALLTALLQSRGLTGTWAVA